MISPGESCSATLLWLAELRKKGGALDVGWVTARCGSAFSSSEPSAIAYGAECCWAGCGVFIGERADVLDDGEKAWPLDRDAHDRRETPFLIGPAMLKEEKRV